MKQPDYRGRTMELLNRASLKIKADCATMHADHSARGCLQSGNTIIRAIEIWTETSSQHLETALNAFGATIDTRGRRWGRAMREAQDALDAHAVNAPNLLSDSFRLANPAGGSGGSTIRAAHSVLAEAHGKLSATIADFRDGWTAPRAKKWNERHPIAFALLMAGIGAVLATVARLLFR